MDFSIPEELRLLQGAVRRYTEGELVPLEQPFSAVERLPLEIVQGLEAKVKAMGLWALGVTADLGGGELSLVGQCVVQEELHRAFLPYYPAPWHGFGGNPHPALFACRGEQRDRLLLPVVRGDLHASLAQAEPEGGSDLAGVRTRAERENGSYVLNGAKCFVVGAEERTDLWLVLATVDRSTGRDGVTCFAVERDRPGVSAQLQPRFIGGAQPYQITLEDCRVPEANRIGAEGEGASLAQAGLGRNRILYAPRTAGIGERCLEMAARHSKQRVTFGQPLSNRQAIQWMLADMAVDTEVCRTLGYKAAWLADQGQDVRDISAKVKLFATEAAGRIIDRCIQVFGVSGLTHDMPLARLWKTIRCQRVSDGPSEIMRFVIARNVLRGA